MRPLGTPALDRTDERAAMPIRERPEAGYLPTLASGRLFFARRRVLRRGGDRVTLLRRSPREVYRVYTEEEYLNGAGLEPAVALTEGWPVAPARIAAHARRLHRVVGMALLAGAVGTVGGVVAANNPWAQRGVGRRPGSLVAEARSPRVVRSRITRSSVPARPVVTHRTEAARSHIARAVGSDPHPPNRQPSGTRLPGHPHGGVAIVVDYAPGAPAGGVSASSASADGSVAAPPVGASTTTASPADEAPAPAASASAATERTGAGAESKAEFGFER